MSLTPKEIPTGAVRFNTDRNNMEVYIGSTWMEVSVSSPNLGDTQSPAGARGLFFGGRESPGTVLNTIDYVTISSAGNAIDFGDLNSVRRANATYGDRTRGLTAGGINSPTGGDTTAIDFVTFSSTGDSTDFGALTVSRSWLAGVNNATRGIAGGAWSPSNSDVMDYVTIQSTGNAVDFGDLTEAQQTDGSFSSPTRGFWVGGAAGSGPDYQASTTGRQIECVTTTTLGNAFDFGDLTNGTYGKVGASNSVRGLAAGGYGSPANILVIELLTMATLGNASNFGDMTISHYYGYGTSAPTRAIFAGGEGATNIIEYVNFATEGDGTDFGDLTSAKRQGRATSNANGRL